MSERCPQAIEAEILLQRVESEPWERLSAVRLLRDIAIAQEYVSVEPMIRLLVQSASREDSPEVLTEIIGTIGTVASPLGLSVLTANVFAESSSVREAVAANLPFLVDETNAVQIEEALVTLMSDESASVRDWATLGVGSQALLTDMAEYFMSSLRARTALIQRAELDTDPEVRGEALLGLARRSDPEAVRLVGAELQGYSVSRNVLEAAILLSDPRLERSLQVLNSWWTDDPKLLKKAIEVSSS